MHPRARKVIRLLVLTLLLVVLTGYGQDYPIRTRVDLVVVPVTVKGSGGRLITGLTQDDFIVLEDGRKQIITNFTADPVPLSAAVLVDTGLTPGSLSKVQHSPGRSAISMRSRSTASTNSSPRFSIFRRTTRLWKRR